MKSSSLMIAKRIHSLLIFKCHEATGISKRLVAEAIGTNHNSVQTWRSLYIKRGIKLLTSHYSMATSLAKLTPNKSIPWICGAKICS